MDLGQAVAVWLHSMATVVLIGYYGLLAFVVLPVLGGAADGALPGRAIPAIERRVLPLLVAAVGVLLATGTYLLVTDDRFPGLGHVFAGGWSTLIVVKHLVVIVMVAIAASIDLLVVPDVANPVDEGARTVAIRRFARGASAIAILGAFVLLLTAAVQAS